MAFLKVRGRHTEYMDRMSQQIEILRWLWVGLAEYMDRLSQQIKILRWVRVGLAEDMDRLSQQIE